MTHGEKTKKCGFVRWVAVACDGGGLRWPATMVLPWCLGDGVPPWVLGLNRKEQNKRERRKREKVK